jgi:hypothetical protein
LVILDVRRSGNSATIPEPDTHVARLTVVYPAIKIADQSATVVREWRAASSMRGNSF